MEHVTCVKQRSLSCLRHFIGSNLEVELKLLMLCSSQVVATAPVSPVIYLTTLDQDYDCFRAEDKQASSSVVLNLLCQADGLTAWIHVS